ncbi:RNB domain-containing ribonuclease [Streptomyces palmae]|uniref:RNB domain-containing ribonuclease n=1 Tax=Streptomyces palmae TaxID=1701085 RepID=A0A4Z0GYQ8_9ACTN|nr:RNB domain-containing ribonuclease [Streptomyces palmae]TGB03037.1 RNB domain-containing ribonuclease [Streptomyces palmae]
MPRRLLRVPMTDGAELRAALRALRGELGLPEAFPAAVLAEAEQAAAYRRPVPDREDARELPLFSLDSPEAADLERAMFLARRPGGFRVHYAVADIAAFVVPGGPLDLETRQRATTVYFPDARVPLHPDVLTRDAAALLPDQDRPALLWQLDLDEFGELVFAHVRRAVVRSRARLDHAGVQRELDTGAAEEPLSLLRDIGLLRQELERSRGGLSLTVPEQHLVPRGAGYGLAYQAPLPVQGWNAQISLLTGAAAADLMLAAGTGILRTVPAAPDGAVGRLRRVARALGVDWPHGTSYAEVVRSLVPDHRATPGTLTRDEIPPPHAAFLQECTALLRGAGYTAFDGDPPDPAPARHAALADDYAHCTAPLHRLVDRYTGELCLAAAEGTRPPEWVRAALDALPGEMARGAGRATAAERESVDLMEAAVLHGRVGEVFDGVVVDVAAGAPSRGTVHLHDPPVAGRLVAAPSGAALPLGKPLRVRLLAADPGREKARFAPA